MGLNTTTALQFGEDSFVAMNFTGGTKGQALLGVSDHSLGWNNENIEITALEDNFKKYYIGTSSSWTLSVGFQMRNQTGSTAIDEARWSGDTNLLLANYKTITGLDAFEYAKQKNLTVRLIIKLKNGNYQKGNAIITSFSIDNAVGSLTTGSIEFQGTGDLVKSTS